MIFVLKNLAYQIESLYIVKILIVMEWIDTNNDIYYP